MTNYEKALKLVAMNLATKDEKGCIEFEVGDDEAYGWIYPNEDFVTIFYGEDSYNFGDIDLHRIQVVVGCEKRYSIG